MFVSRIIVILFLLLSFLPVSSQEREVRLLHYNLFQAGVKSHAQYKLKKETALKDFVGREKALIFSVLEDGSRENFVSKEAFYISSEYELREITSSELQHSLYFRKDSVRIQQSEDYDLQETQFFYYQLALKGATLPLHLIVCKQPAKQNAARQLKDVLNFIVKRGIVGQLLILGGSDVQTTSGESYFLPGRNTVELMNPIAFSTLYDDSYGFVWHNQMDFIFVSMDMWLPGEGPISLVRKDIYFEKESAVLSSLKKVSENCPLDISLNLQSQFSDKQYLSPKVDIIAQDKKSLEFSILWNEDADLNIEIVSMIGNKFLTRSVQYRGKEEKYRTDLSSYPTGIYLLKVNDKKDCVVVRRFTKY